MRLKSYWAYLLELSLRERLRVHLNAGEVSREVEEAGGSLVIALLKHGLEHPDGSLYLSEGLVSLALQGQLRTLDLEVLVHILEVALAEPPPLAQLPEQLDQLAAAGPPGCLEPKPDDLQKQVEVG